MLLKEACSAKKLELREVAGRLILTNVIAEQDRELQTVFCG
ncbi:MULTISPECIES: hypothetical protein [unclassified Bartonella]